MTEPGAKAVRLTIRGRVQGVGFRWHVREAARRASVAGWVRNCPDGSVEVLVAGDPAAVDRVVEAARTGPPAARVDAVEVQPEPGAQVPPTFTMK